MPNLKTPPLLTLTDGVHTAPIRFNLSPSHTFQKNIKEQSEVIPFKDTICRDISVLSYKDYSFKVSRSSIGIADLIQNILNQLSIFDFGRDVISAFQTGDWTLALHAADDQTPRVLMNERILSLPNDNMATIGILRSPYFKNRFILSFLKGLRQIDRLENIGWPPFLSPRSFITARRIEQADQTVVAIYLSYLLSNALPDLWHHVRVIEDSDMVIVTSGPDGDSRDGALLFDWEQSFYIWFTGFDRVYSVDHQSLLQVDHVLQASADPTRDRYDLTESDIDRFCTKEDQRPYLKKIIKTMMMGGMHPIHTAYLSQIERDQTMVIWGAVGIRDRDLAGRLFGQGT